MALQRREPAQQHTRPFEIAMSFCEASPSVMRPAAETAASDLHPIIV